MEKVWDLSIKLRVSKPIPSICIEYFYNPKDKIEKQEENRQIVPKIENKSKRATPLP